jgi:ribosome modulation factor
MAGDCAGICGAIICTADNPYQNYLPATARHMSGWRQAMNDTLEWAKAFSPEQRTALNRC